MSRWIWYAIIAAAVLLVVLYGSKAWAAYVKPTAPVLTSDPALQKQLWADATAYGESIPLSR